MTEFLQVNELLNLKGRQALITGSNQGIGLSIARRLAQAGASVILHGRRETKVLNDLSKELRDRIQNHSFNDVSSKHYDRWEYLPEKRKALEAWEQWCLALKNEDEK